MAELTSAESTVLAAMLRLVDRWGEVSATMVELSEETGYGRTSLSKAVAGLRLAGLIQVTRTKRNFGKLYKNRYLILDRTSTADSYGSYSQTTVPTKVLNTSYLIGGEAPEKEDQMVNKWNDDDSIGGFGLFEEEINKPTAASKRDPKTRNQRPQEEWTSADVAAEFSSQLYSRIRGIPGLINTAKLRPILAKYRKEYGTTSILELEVINLLVGDSRRLESIKREPHNAYKIFLSMLKTHNHKAMENIGLANVDDDEEPTAQYVYASDGKAFDNSMPGRAALERYEEKLNQQ
jgi:hypothetical protein